MQDILSIFSGNTQIVWSADVALICLVFIGVSVYALSWGKRKTLLTIFALWTALVLYYVGVPFAQDIVALQNSLQMRGWMAIGVFLFLVAAIYFLLSGSGVSLAIRLSLKKEGAPWWHAVLLAVSCGALFAGSLAYVSATYFTLSPLVKGLILEDNNFFWWVIFPLVAIALVRRRED